MKAIIFDMDGLMIDSERLYIQAENEIAGQFGAEVKKETIWKMMGRKPIESIRVFVHELGLNEKPESILEMRNKIMREKLKKDLIPMPGLFEIIEGFFARLDLAISTGAPKEFLDIVLDKLDIREKFTVLQTSDDILNGKPDPEIYVKTCERLGLKSCDCIVLEDSSNGVLSGNRAGCYTMAVPSDYTREQDFSVADFIALNLLDAQNHIDYLLRANQGR